MNGEELIILVPWQALAFVFALLPGILLISYCLSCGLEGKKPSFRDYWKLFKSTKKAQKEAYRKTASFFSSNSLIIKLLIFLFILIVFIVGPHLLLKLICLFLTVPISVIAYFMGKKARYKSHN